MADLVTFFIFFVVIIFSALLFGGWVIVSLLKGVGKVAGLMLGPVNWRIPSPTGCTECGKMNPPWAKFCRRCGRPQPDPLSARG
jgi:hypothetical protein